MTKWAIEYEAPAAEAFRLNHPGATTFTDNCNVILARAMANAGLQADCRASPEVLQASLPVASSWLHQRSTSLCCMGIVRVWSALAMRSTCTSMRAGGASCQESCCENELASHFAILDAFPTYLLVSTGPHDAIGTLALPLYFDGSHAVILTQPLAAQALEMADKMSGAGELPAPGQVDFIVGGPPCQGYSGMNRFNKGNWSMVQNSMVRRPVPRRAARLPTRVGEGRGSRAAACHQEQHAPSLQQCSIRHLRADSHCAAHRVSAR